jgi:predicted cupin superfamily sugar epimerase
MTAKDYIDYYNMLPHPEGGYYLECFRSEQSLHFPGFDGPRNYSTSILFLLEAGQTSSLHRIKSDEIWYHHDGGCLIITEIDEQDNHHVTLLGKDFKTGQQLQHVVKAGRWFGARPLNTDFVLVGCQVTPGFDFRDFELKNP